MEFKQVLKSPPDILENQSVPVRRHVPQMVQKDYIADWQISGLSQAQFCKENGLNPKSLSRWLKCHANASTLSPAGSLTQEKIDANKARSEKTSSKIEVVELDLLAGVSISLKGDLDPDFILSLIQESFKWK